VGDGAVREDYGHAHYPVGGEAVLVRAHAVATV
jgi:hypothetical protein